MRLWAAVKAVKVRMHLAVLLRLKLQLLQTGFCRCRQFFRRLLFLCHKHADALVLVDHVANSRAAALKR
jgi:hypothetical protein